MSDQVNRIWILGDLHLGVRNNSTLWLNIQKEFLNTFINILHQNAKPGDVLVQLGDVFDNRRSTDTRVLNYAISLFETLGNILPVHIITGNHDLFAKKNHELTSLKSLKHIPGINIYTQPEVKHWGGKKCLLMPWRISHEEEKATLSQYKHCDLVFCHSEPMDVYTNSKIKSDYGLELENYAGFERIYSGHIHFRQDRHPLKLVGTPYQLTRSDIDNPKGIDLLDLDTMEENFYQNNISPRFLRYDITKLYNFKLGEFKNQIYGNFVDLYIPADKSINQALSHLLNKVQDYSLSLDPIIYQQNLYQDKDFEDLDTISADYDILSLSYKHIDSLDYDEELKTKLKHSIKQLYDECVQLYAK